MSVARHDDKDCDDDDDGGTVLGDLENPVQSTFHRVGTLFLQNLSFLTLSISISFSNMGLKVPLAYILALNTYYDLNLSMKSGTLHDTGTMGTRECAPSSGALGCGR